MFNSWIEHPQDGITFINTDWQFTSGDEEFAAAVNPPKPVTEAVAVSPIVLMKLLLSVLVVIINTSI